MTDTPVDDVVGALQRAGFRAESEEFYPGPTDVRIAIDGGELLLARHHNVEGWEAAVEMPGRDQYGVQDGPAADAPATEVLVWVGRLISQGLKPA